MICTFILCSRGSPNGLIRAIESIYSTASNPDQVEVLIRMDDDDEPTVTAWKTSHAVRCAEISSNIRAFFGPREKGYLSLKDFTIKLAAESTGDWMCMWNDDAVMLADEGAKPWDDQLAKLPVSGVIVQPGTYKLNNSVYKNCFKSAFPFFPNNSWKKFNVDFWNDYEASDILTGHGWRTHHLKGITVWHDRIDDRWK